MKIKLIVVELEPEADEAGHATQIRFENQMFQANGPVYPRFLAALSEFWVAIRGRK